MFNWYKDIDGSEYPKWYSYTEYSPTLMSSSEAITRKLYSKCDESTRNILAKITEIIRSKCDVGESSVVIDSKGLVKSIIDNLEIIKKILNHLGYTVIDNPDRVSIIW